MTDIESGGPARGRRRGPRRPRPGRPRRRRLGRHRRGVRPRSVPLEGRRRLRRCHPRRSSVARPARRDVPFLDTPGVPPQTRHQAWMWLVYAVAGLRGRPDRCLDLRVDRRRHRRQDVGADAGHRHRGGAARVVRGLDPAGSVDRLRRRTVVGQSDPGHPELRARPRACVSGPSTWSASPSAIGGQILVAVMYAPFQRHIHNFNAPSQRLTGGAHGGGFVIIALATVVVAPFMEELFFRGLVLKALVRLFTPLRAAGGARTAGVVVAVVVDGLLFGLAHGEWVQLAGLAAFGMVLAAHLVPHGSSRHEHGRPRLLQPGGDRGHRRIRDRPPPLIPAAAGSGGGCAATYRGSREPHARGLQGVRHPGHRPRPAQRGHVSLLSGGPSPASPGRSEQRQVAPVGCWSPGTCASRGSSSRRRSPTACAPRASAVTDLGMASTDFLYFASGHLDAPGAMFTASHNPAQYNGMKLCLAGARPIGSDTGLEEIAAEAEKLLGEPLPPLTGDRRRARPARCLGGPRGLVRRRGVPAPPQGGGGHGERDGRPGRARWCSGACPSRSRSSSRSSTAPSPTTPPTRSSRRTWSTLKEAVLAQGADVGLAFDGDADRVFLVDEKAEPVSGSLTTALVAASMLRKHPGETILYNLICSHVVPRSSPSSAARRCVPAWAIRSSRRSWPSPAPCSEASTRATTTTGTISGPTRGSSPPCSSSSCSARATVPVRAARTLQALCGLRRDQHRGGQPGRHGGGAWRRTSERRVRRSTCSTASPWSARTGGTTCVRPTPSRCSGSMSRPPPPRSARSTWPRCRR